MAIEKDSGESFSLFNKSKIWYNHTMKDVQDKVFEVVGIQLGKRKDSLSLENSIKDDLGADWLDFVELIMAIEKEFEIGISDEDADKIVTVGDLIEYVKSRVSN